MITNLVGRKVTSPYSSSDMAGTIVAVFFDRGELLLAVENCEGGLYTMSATAVHLKPCPE